MTSDVVGLTPLLQMHLNHHILKRHELGKSEAQRLRHKGLIGPRRSVTKKGRTVFNIIRIWQEKYYGYLPPVDAKGIIILTKLKEVGEIRTIEFLSLLPYRPHAIRRRLSLCRTYKLVRYDPKLQCISVTERGMDYLSLINELKSSIGKLPNEKRHTTLPDSTE